MSRVALAALFTLVAARSLADERGDAHAGLEVFAQPASGDLLLVVTPTVTGQTRAFDWLHVNVAWGADIVTGATPRTYGSPDVITAATMFTEVRNTIGTGADATFGRATVTAGYTYSTENDYRSHLIRTGLSLDLLDHDLVVAGTFDYSINRVCDLDQANLPVTLRQPLDNSRGCFSGAAGLTEEPLDIDTAELSLTLTLTPKLVAMLVGSYQHLDGFQSNPYQRVRLFDGAEQPQESHPMVRDRGAITARVRYAIQRLRASLGGELRLYRDTWGIQSITAGASWEQPFPSTNWRFSGAVRGYLQSRAFFYRDAGEADSYEAVGPVGSFFTADQELAPLADLLLTGRFVYTTPRKGDRRIGGIFLHLETALVAQYLKIFALTPDPPNVARTQGFASGILFGLSLTGQF